MKPLMAAKMEHKTAGHGRTLRKLLFITKAEFFLFSSGFRQDPLAKGGYFTQFCLAVMTNQIKSVFTDQNIIKRANKTSGLEFQIAPSRYLPAPLPARG